MHALSRPEPKPELFEPELVVAVKNSGGAVSHIYVPAHLAKHLLLRRIKYRRVTFLYTPQQLGDAVRRLVEGGQDGAGVLLERDVSVGFTSLELCSATRYQR